METRSQAAGPTCHGPLEMAVAAYFDAPEIADGLDRLSDRLPAAAHLLVLGGAIRNIVMARLIGTAPPTEDIDVFIDGLPAGYPLAGALAGERLGKCDLGGLRWRPAGALYRFDLCLLPDFVIIRQYQLPADRRTLLENVDFTINAVLYEPAARRLEDRGCVTAIRRREIEFNTLRHAAPLLTVYRILLMAYRTGFLLASRPYAYLRRHADPQMLMALRRLLPAKQQAAAGALSALLNRVLTAPDYAAYRRWHRSRAATAP